MCICNRLKEVTLIDANELDKKYQETTLVFAERLRYLIDKSNLRQTDLADLLDVTPPHISRMVTGKATPKFKTLVKIVSIFNCSYDFLLSKDNFPDEIRYTTAAVDMMSTEHILKEKRRNQDVEISEEIAEITLDLVKRAVIELLKKKDEK